MTVKEKLFALSLSAGLVGTLLATPAQAAEILPAAEEKSDAAIPALDLHPTITASPEAKLTNEKPTVTTAAATAPVVEAPVEVVQPVSQTESISTASKSTPVAAVQPVAASSAPAAPAPAPKPVQAVASSGKGAAILAAAYAQIGVVQDCTMLVTNALSTVGINFHDWPAGYLSLGPTVSAAQAKPGDLVYYANGGSGMAHIAVYAGNGMAVHGGFNGNQTVLFNVNVGSGPVYISM